MRIGYARVSTTDQHLESQLDALKVAGCEKIYEEQASGGGTLPTRATCLEHLRDGDSLVVWRLDRLGRSTTDLVHILGALETRGVQFVSITEAIDTKTPSGRLLFHVMAALAEFERELIRERTAAGLAAARARGRHPGRKAALTTTQIDMVKDLRTAGRPVTLIAEQFNVARNTIYKALRTP
jgi:DNA invertase Pin-like site-specific DNA recombinase